MPMQPVKWQHGEKTGVASLETGHGITNQPLFRSWALQALLLLQGVDFVPLKKKTLAQSGPGQVTGMASLETGHGITNQPLFRSLALQALVLLQGDIFIPLH